MTIQNANHIQNQVAIAIATQRESSLVTNGGQEQHDQPESERRRSFTLSATAEYGDSGVARSDGIMTEVHKCFMVSGIDGEYEYLISLGAPEWAVAEALAFAQKDNDDDSDLDDLL